jgi:Domain of unknown function (DUF1883)
MMRDGYHDRGQQQEDCCAVFRMRGGSANVIPLDPLNFYRYRNGQFVFYIGGYRRRCPFGFRSRPGSTGVWSFTVAGARAGSARSLRYSPQANCARRAKTK